MWWCVRATAGMLELVWAVGLGYAESRRGAPIAIVAGLLLAFATMSCGGDERQPSNAPLPEAWERHDATRGQRPPSLTLGEPDQAAATTAGQSSGSGDATQERALRNELQALLGEVWSAEPGFPRASRSCRSEARVVDLATRWRAAVMSAHADRRAQLEPAIGDLDASITALREACAAGDIEAAPEPVEGSFQGVAEEVDSLARSIDDL